MRPARKQPVALPVLLGGRLLRLLPPSLVLFSRATRVSATQSYAADSRVRVRRTRFGSRRVAGRLCGGSLYLSLRTPVTLRGRPWRCNGDAQLVMGVAPRARSHPHAMWKGDQYPQLPRFPPLFHPVLDGSSLSPFVGTCSLCLRRW